MDAPSPNAINPSAPRQRSSPANDHPHSPPPMSQQQPYPYPVQQQQAAWSPPPQQFYPSFYQNPHQQPYPMHPHPGHPQQGQMPYYDPANAQLAQWAYHQMMFNAQQAHQMSQMSPMGQRARSGSNPTPDYFGGQSPMAGFNPFPSGTPPPHPSQLPMGFSPAHSDQGSQYGGYHPYRRPQRQGSSNQDPDWRPNGSQHGGSFKPPYAHADAAGSSTSVNSSSSHSGSHRQRTNSNQGSTSGSPASGPQAHSHSKQSSSRSSASGSVSPPATNGSSQRMHHQRTGSSSSSASARPSPPPAATTSPSAAPQVNLRKPSPLSQGTFTAAEKRMSRDDSDLAAMMDSAGGPRVGGLKGRLRRALSMNANATLHEADEEDPRLGAPRPSQSSIGSNPTLAMDDSDSTATVQKKKSRSLFNNKFNRSTDNISLSSTMSSASMVIRKLGSIGKLARRNSLAGITSLFKDKNKDEEEGGSGKKGKKKKGEKGVAADPSVSHVTAELDRSDWSSSPEMAGLSPAARLARQHTLKSNAEAAAKAKAEAEARAAAQAQGAAVPTTWEKNTTNRGDSPAKLAAARVGENGMRVVVEHDDSDSDDGRSGDGHDNHAHNYSIEGWEDDEDWGDGHEEEDVTIRQALDSTSIDEDDADMEPWAINVRRSVERTRVPAKGILKSGSIVAHACRRRLLILWYCRTRGRVRVQPGFLPSAEPRVHPDTLELVRLGPAGERAPAPGSSPAVGSSADRWPPQGPRVCQRPLPAELDVVPAAPVVRVRRCDHGLAEGGDQQRRKPCRGHRRREAVAVQPPELVRARAIDDVLVERAHADAPLCDRAREAPRVRREPVRVRHVPRGGVRPAQRAGDVEQVDAGAGAAYQGGAQLL